MLIAREPAERRPTIRAWLPRGLVPPEVASAKPSTQVMMVKSLRSAPLHPLSHEAVLYWRRDIFRVDDLSSTLPKGTPLWPATGKTPPPLRHPIA